MDTSRQQNWIPAALFVGFVYALVGRLFALPTDHAHFWRLAAWLVSGLAFATHITYEHIRLGHRPGVLALHAARSLLIKQQTMVTNAVRGLATEFGFAVPKGIGKLEGLVAAVEVDDALPAEARQAIGELHRHCTTIAARIAKFEAQIVGHAREDAMGRLLATIPGIGPITASLIAATIGANIASFKSARHFAAWLGLVPKQHSTGGKTRLGRVTKAGNAEIRKLLVLGATSMVYRAEQWNSSAGK